MAELRHCGLVDCSARTRRLLLVVLVVITYVTTMTALGLHVANSAAVDSIMQKRRYEILLPLTHIEQIEIYIVSYPIDRL